METALKSEPINPALFNVDDEFDAEKIDEMKEDNILRCTRDLLLVEREGVVRTRYTGK